MQSAATPGVRRSAYDWGFNTEKQKPPRLTGYHNRYDITGAAVAFSALWVIVVNALE